MIPRSVGDADMLYWAELDPKPARFSGPGEADEGIEPCPALIFPDLFPGDFCSMWCESHRVPDFRDQSEAMHYMVRRIEWRYLDQAAAG